MRVTGFEPAGSAEPQHLEGAEVLLGIAFPASYKALMREFSGADGDAEFPVPGSEHPMGIGHWLSLSPWSELSIWTCLATWSEHELPSRLIPVGEDGGGNLICLDYRRSPDPTVTLWFHELNGEDALWEITANFDAFLRSLREPGSDEDQEA